MGHSLHPSPPPWQTSAIIMNIIIPRPQRPLQVFTFPPLLYTVPLALIGSGQWAQKLRPFITFCIHLLIEQFITAKHPSYKLNFVCCLFCIGEYQIFVKEDSFSNNQNQIWAGFSQDESGCVRPGDIFAKRNQMKSKVPTENWMGGGGGGWGGAISSKNIEKIDKKCESKVYWVHPIKENGPLDIYIVHILKDCRNFSYFWNPFNATPLPLPRSPAGKLNIARIADAVQWHLYIFSNKDRNTLKDERGNLCCNKSILML